MVLPVLPAAGVPGLHVHPLHYLLDAVLAWWLCLEWQYLHVQLAPGAYGCWHGGILRRCVTGVPPAPVVGGAQTALETPPCSAAPDGLHPHCCGAGCCLYVSQPWKDCQPVLPAQLAGHHCCLPLRLPVVPGLCCLPPALGVHVAAQPPETHPRLFGAAILSLSIASVISGINEKLFFSLKNTTRPYNSLPSEAVFANSTGMLVAAFAAGALHPSGFILEAPRARDLDRQTAPAA